MQTDLNTTTKTTKCFRSVKSQTDDSFLYDTSQHAKKAENTKQLADDLSISGHPTDLEDHNYSVGPSNLVENPNIAENANSDSESDGILPDDTSEYCPVSSASSERVLVVIMKKLMCLHLKKKRALFLKANLISFLKSVNCFDA